MISTLIGRWIVSKAYCKNSSGFLIFAYAVSPSNTLDQPGLVPGTLPWLESNEALALATRMETRLPWRPTRGSLTSPSYLVRNRTRGPPLENNPEIPPSSRDEGLRLLHGLATNLATGNDRSRTEPGRTRDVRRDVVGALQLQELTGASG